MNALELKIPPVVVVLITGGLMWALSRALPLVAIAFPGQTIVAAVIGSTGIALGAAGIIVFRRMQTTVHPSEPEKASAVVAEGVYRFSRNPMYLGLALLLTGWALFLGAAANIALLAVFVAYMNRFQIKPEERALEAKFGASYTDYRRSVRRWL